MCTVDAEVVAEGWWCERERFLYWRRPGRPPSTLQPDRHDPGGACDRPVIVVAGQLADDFGARPVAAGGADTNESVA
jgi:hypothetical protein